MSKTNIEYHEVLMENLPDSYRKWFDEEEKYLQKNVKESSRILCVACGDGREIKYILDKGEIIGIDHDEKAVKYAQNNFKDESNIKIILAEAANLPFDNGEFDYVTCMGSFTNFADDKIPALKEMKRVVKRGGKIILSAYSENSMEERIKIYKELGFDSKIKEIRKDEGKVIFDESVGDNISEHFSEKQLRDFFDEVDLEVEEIKKVGIGYICRLSK